MRTPGPPAATATTAAQHRPRPVDDKDAAAEPPIQVLPHAAQHADPRKGVARVRKVLNVRTGPARNRLGRRGSSVRSCAGAQQGGRGGARRLGGAPAVAQREDELCGCGAKSVDLELGELVGGQVGAEVREHARGLDGACVVGQDDHPVGLVVLQRGADGVVEERVGRQRGDGAPEREEGQVYREAVGFGQEGGYGAVEEAG